MRVQISRHLKVRAITIRTAIKGYNDAAMALVPPRPKLDVNKVLNMAFLADFDTLRYTRPGSDISEKPWSKPSVRVLSDKYFDLVRAKEELVRLNVEWRRVKGWILDERSLYLATIDGLKNAGNSNLASAVQSRWNRVEKNHRIIQHWLAKTQQLDGFSANTALGKAINKEKGCHEILSMANSYRIEGDDLVEGDDGEVGQSREETDTRASFLSGHQFEREGDLIDSIGRMAV